MAIRAAAGVEELFALFRGRRETAIDQEWTGYRLQRFEISIHGCRDLLRLGAEENAFDACAHCGRA